MKVIAQVTMASNSQFLTVGDAKLVHAAPSPAGPHRIDLYFETYEEALTEGISGPPREFRYVFGQTPFPDTFDHALTVEIEDGVRLHILRAIEDLG